MATTISVTGMSCDGCEDIVETSLEEVDGVESAEADQHENTATVEGDANVEDLVEAVDTAGYEGSATDTGSEAETGAGDDEADSETDSDGVDEDEDAEAEETEE